MLRNLAILFLILIFVSIATSVLPCFSVFGVTPNLLLILVVSWGLLRGSKEAALLGFFVGITQDVLSSTLYFHAVSMCLIGFGSGIFGTAMSGSGPALAVAMVSIMRFLSFLIEGVLLYFFLGQSVPPALSLSIIVVLSIAYNGLLALPVFPVVRALSLWIGISKTDESFSF